MIHRYIIEATDEVKGFEEAIERLDREWGIEELEPCEDVISREEAKQFLYERIDRLNDDDLYDIFSKIIDDMYNELPSVTPQPKIGHWIPVSERLPEVSRERNRLMKKFDIKDDPRYGRRK